MSLAQDFKTFVSRGNIVDLSIGVIIGGAFGKIVDSLVKDVIMPPISFIMSGVDVSSWKQVIAPASTNPVKPEVAITYGNFLQASLNFLIIALVIFIIIQFLHRLKRKEEALPVVPAGPTQEQLLTEIRDLLAKRPA